MKLSNFTAHLLIATLSLGLGLATLLFTNYGIDPAPAWAAHINATCVRTLYSGDNRVTDYSPDTQTISVRTLGIHPERSHRFQEITITDDPNRIFEATPPTPLDYAVILQKLYDQGYRSVVLTTRMTWDKEPTPQGKPSSSPQDPQALTLEFEGSSLSAQALSYKLSQFDHAVIAVPVTRGATPQPLPAALNRALIPFKQVQGNHTHIPIVNQVPLPTSITDISGNDTLFAGFHHIESAPSDLSTNPKIPLLAHWENKGLLPSIELLTMMSAHGTSPAELTVQCGEHIQLGKTGPVIPIDKYGQTKSPFKKPQQQYAPIQAETLISSTRNPSNLGPLAPSSEKSTSSTQAQPTTIALIHATGEKTSSTNLLTPDRLTNLIALCETAPTPGAPTHYQKLPIGFEALIIIILAIIASRLTLLPTYYRNLSFILSVPALLILLITLMQTNQQWFALIPTTTTLFSAYCLKLRNVR